MKKVSKDSPQATEIEYSADNSELGAYTIQDIYNYTSQLENQIEILTKALEDILNIIDHGETDIIQSIKIRAKWALKKHKQP